ncbi:hypothetical protein F2Q69_00000897 [Brassica cretica]|uniref:Uncharacterized protein n=1 Tax=Brassica cretica TaxID=69181 RepID=A0A8S9P8L2_BRACR|nr:hypothetical protein F2Q69_00000897 [Brassica cretica]
MSTTSMHIKVYNRSSVVFEFGFNIAAVLETDAYQQLKDECLSLQSELLKAVAGYEEASNSTGGAKSQSVWAQLSDGGGDTSSRHVRQRTT